MRDTSHIQVVVLLMAAGAAGCHPAQQEAAVRTGPPLRPVVAPTAVVSFSAPDSIGGFSEDVGAARRLSDGRIAVADWGAKQVLLFDAQGRFLRLLGKGGNGPGEFERPELLQVVTGDSLLVWDQMLRRLTWIDAASGNTRTEAVTGSNDAQRFTVIGRLETGDLLIEEFRPPLDGETIPREQVRFTVGPPEGNGRRRVVASLKGPTYGGMYFYAPTALGATDGRRIVTGESSAWDLAVLDANGDPLGSLVRAWLPPASPPEGKTLMRQLYASHRAAAALTADDRFFPTVPAFGGLVLGADGSSWVSGYRLPYQPPDSVTVFDRNGRLADVISLPEGLTPTDAGPTFLLGKGTDEDGTVQIRQYEVRWIP